MTMAMPLGGGTGVGCQVGGVGGGVRGVSTGGGEKGAMIDGLFVG